MEYKAILIPTLQCRGVWKRVKTHLESAIAASKGRWQPEYVLAALVLNEQSLWSIIDQDGKCFGAATTQCIDYPERRILAIHYLGGENFDDWYTILLDALTNYAREQGCDAIECNARFGFWKWFKYDGFERISMFYEKTL